MTVCAGQRMLLWVFRGSFFTLGFYESKRCREGERARGLHYSVMPPCLVRPNGRGQHWEKKGVITETRDAREQSFPTKSFRGRGRIIAGDSISHLRNIKRFLRTQRHVTVTRLSKMMETNELNILTQLVIVWHIVSFNCIFFPVVIDVLSS